MQIKFLGTGSAFTIKNFQTNLALKYRGKYLILDAGGDLRFALKEAGIPLKSVDGVYISHLHTDHAGGIEYLGFSTFFDSSRRDKKIKLYGNGQLLRDGWEDTWKGGLESIQGHLMTLKDFFELNPIVPNGTFFWGKFQFDIVQSIHIMNGYSIVPCYGLMIRSAFSSTGRSHTKTIFWTSDCQFCPNQIMDFYKQADLIIQDCETTSFKSGVHANFSELVTLPTEIKNRMILVHYQDNVLDENGKISTEWAAKAAEAGFKGFAAKGADLEF